MPGSVCPAAEAQLQGSLHTRSMLCRNMNYFVKPAMNWSHWEATLASLEKSGQLWALRKQQEEKGDVIGGNLWDVEVQLREMWLFSLQKR